MEYCLVLINLFEPWMSGPDADITVDSDGPDSDGGPTIRDVGARARARLETLIRLYNLRHSFDTLEVKLIMYLMLLGSISVRVLAPGAGGDGGDGTQRDASTFLLCAKGLHDQGQNQYLGSLMFNMLSGLVDPKNQALVSDLSRIKAEFCGTEVKPEYVHMEWPVYSWIDAENQEFGRLLEGVDDLSIGDEESVDE
jgi:hypothetical protein